MLMSLWTNFFKMTMMGATLIIIRLFKYDENDDDNNDNDDADDDENSNMIIVNTRIMSVISRYRTKRYDCYR